MKRPSLIDLSGLVVAYAVGALSLAYPLSRVQGEQAYVGLAWLRGEAIYRDLWARHPPGVYLLQGVAASLGGSVGIRWIGLLATVVVGWGAAGLAASRERRRGLVGIGAALAAVLAFEFFDFGEVGQGDLVVGALALASARLARSGCKWRRLLSGVLAALLVMISPWSALFAVVAVGLGLTRFRSPVAFGAGFAFAWVALGLALLSTGDLGAALSRALHGDCLRGPTPPLGSVFAIGHELMRRFYPLPAIGIAAVALTWLAPKRLVRQPAPFWLIPVFLFVAVDAVWTEGSLAPGRWIQCVAPCVVAFAIVAAAWPATRLVRALALANVVLMFSISFVAFKNWYEQTKLTRAVARGDAPQAKLDASFNRELASLDHEKNVALARWLGEHSSPDDRVLIRGYEPQVYVLADRRASQPFFATPQLVAPICGYTWGEAIPRDRASIERDPPRYVVAVGFVAFGPDAPSTFEGLGYRRVRAFGDLVVLERKSP